MNRQKLNRRFHALLNQLGIVDKKEAVVSAYGVASSRDMTDDQLLDAIKRLEEEESKIRTQGEQRIKTHRSVVLRLLTDIGVYYVAPKETKSACWDRVNDFLLSPKIAGCELYKLNEMELKALERKLRGLKDKGYRYHPERGAPKIGISTVYMSLPNHNIVS